MAEPADHGLPQKAVEIARPFGFPITNSMVVSWIVAAGLIVFARVATRNMKRVPGGAQNLLEWLVEGLYAFLQNIIGRHLVKRTFLVFCHGVHLHSCRQLGGPHSGRQHDRMGHPTADGFVVDQPLFRGRMLTST